MSRYDSINNVAHAEQLVARIRAGDESAFDRLFRLCYGPLVDFAIRYVPSRDDAEEVVTDLFMRIWEMGARWDVHGMLTTYLFGAVRNRALNVREARAVADRRLQRIHTAAGEVSIEDAVDPFLTSDAAELPVLLQRALQALSPRGREVFLLTQRDGFSIRETAGALGVTAATVQTQLARALNALRRTLGRPD